MAPKNIDKADGKGLLIGEAKKPKPGSRNTLSESIREDGFLDTFTGEVCLGESKQVGGYSFTLASIMATGAIMDVTDTSDGKPVMDGVYIEVKEDEVLQNDPKIVVSLWAVDVKRVFMDITVESPPPMAA